MSEPFEAFGDVEDLAADLASPDATVRRLAVMALAETSDWQAVPHLVAAIADAAPEVREQAARALGEFDGRAVGEAGAVGRGEGGVDGDVRGVRGQGSAQGRGVPAQEHHRPEPVGVRGHQLVIGHALGQAAGQPHHGAERRQRRVRGVGVRRLGVVDPHDVA